MLKKKSFAIMGMALIGLASIKAADLSLIDFSAKSAESQIKINGKTDAQFKIINTDKGKALEVILTPGKNGYPGVTISPEKELWDLSTYGRVDVSITNLSNEKIKLGLRVDNDGDWKTNPWSTENVTIPVRTTTTARVTFGYSWGKKAYALKLSKIARVMVFTSKPKQEMKFRINKIVAAGKTGEKPADAPKIVEVTEEIKLVTPQKNAKLNFDTPGEPFNLFGGYVSKEKGDVISGSGSLLADARGKQKKWFEYFTTKAGLMKGNHKYRIRLRYNVLQTEKGAIFYSLLRSKKKGWGKYDRGWNKITDIPAGPGVIDYEVGIGDLDDYELMLGIHKNAKVAVDEIQIEQIAPFKEASDEEMILARIPDIAKKNATLIDFEDADNSPIKLTKGKFSRDKAYVIAGKQSLFVDTMNGGTWNVFMKTKPGMLKKGNRYYVTYKYKMLDKSGKPKVYMMARSKKYGHGKSMDRGMRMSHGDKGKTRTSFSIMDIWDADDYSLLLGVKGKAKVVIDDIIIRREPLGERKILTRKPLDITKAKLVFCDDFNGKKIDETKWNICGDQNRRGGLWLKKNAYLDGKGNLVLKFDKDKKTGKFAMSAITTAGKFTMKYGYIEARMKVSKEEGHWPGAWLTAQSTNKVGDMGRDGTEIDIVEMPWRHKDEVSHALHWNGYSEDHASTGKHVKIPGINEGWHTFAVDWSPDGYIFFVDGKETWRTNADDVYNVPLHLLLSDEMGGWSGNPNKAKLPDYVYFDYMKAWQ